MTLLDRKVLLEETAFALGGAVIIGVGFYFRSSIEIYLGQTITNYLFIVMVVLFLGRVFIFIGQMICGALATEAGSGRKARPSA
jgi:TM2 domain-containing membrane protein YozV